MNASPIDLGRRNEKFIATHGPLDDETGRFWRMIWQEKTEVVLMLTQPSEKGVIKSAVYYPEKIRELLVVDYGLKMSVQCISVVEEAGTVLRELRISRGEEQRTIWHLFFAGWPDHSAPTPEGQQMVLDLIKMSRFLIPEKKNSEEGLEVEEKGPRVVHCSAGCGRTGTFIALDYLLQEMGEWKMEDLADSDPVFNTVKRLREQRMLMVYTKDQFSFLYKMLRGVWGTHYISGGFVHVFLKENKDSIDRFEPEITVLE